MRKYDTWHLNINAHCLPYLWCKNNFPEYLNGNAVPDSQHLCLKTWAQVFWEFLKWKKSIKNQLMCLHTKSLIFPPSTHQFLGGLMRAKRVLRPINQSKDFRHNFLAKLQNQKTRNTRSILRKLSTLKLMGRPFRCESNFRLTLCKKNTHKVLLQDLIEKIFTIIIYKNNLQKY